MLTAGSIAADQTICAGATPAPLTSASAPSGGTGSFSYQWELSPDNSTWTAIGGANGPDFTPGSLTATTYFRRQVTAGGCSATSAATTVLVNARPVTPTLSAQYNGTNTTLTSSAASGNQFYFNGVVIPGATAATHVVSAASPLGAYTVVVTSAAGCASAASTPLTVTSSVKPLAGTTLSVYPTPTPDGKLRVELTGYRQAVTLTVRNTLGQVVYSATVPAAGGTTTQGVNLTYLPVGVYILQAKSAGGLDTRRVVKE